MIANWHRIKCIDTDEGKNFEGKLPVCDDKTGEVKVIVVCTVGYFKSDFTDEYLSEDEDEFIIESYEIYDDIYRAAHDDIPAHFVKHLSNFVVAWDYVPDFTAESSQTEKENPCKECLCNVDEYCICEKLSLYEEYQQGKADGSREFAEWLEDNSYLNWVGEGNDVNSMSAEEALAEWQKGN